MIDSFVDPATGKVSMGFAGPVKDAAGSTIGLVVYALPVAGIATPMKAAYGGPDNLDFEVTQSATGKLISSSEPSSTSAAPAIDYRSPPEGAALGSDGIRRIYRAFPASATGLTVTAGLPETVAIATARHAMWGHVSLTLVALLLTLALGLLVNRRIGRPLRRLAAAVDQAGRAVTPESVDVNGPTEVRDLVERFNGMLAARASVEDQLHQRVMLDELTGLPNRAVALDRLSHGLERTRRGDNSVAVLSIDLDRFRVSTRAWAATSVIACSSWWPAGSGRPRSQLTNSFDSCPGARGWVRFFLSGSPPRRPREGGSR